MKARQVEDVNVARELPRHRSAKITMDVHAQAVSGSAQGKVAVMVRDTKNKEKSA